MTADSDGTYTVDEVARAWLVKMRSEDAGALRGEFETWLLASADHCEAYRRAEQRMSALAVLKTSERHGRDHTAERRGRGRSWLPLSAAATVLALLIVAVGAGGLSLPGQSDSAPIARAAEPLVTRRGEIRTFRLADGSSATLDTDSRVEVRFAKGHREIRLIKGRVRLSVTRGAVPLRIYAGPSSTSANGAEIDMRIDEAGAVAVALRSGAASLHTVAAAATALSLGETRAIGSDGRMQLSEAQTDAMPRDWPEGWAEYRAIRLERLVAEANRYAAAPIVIDDAPSAARELTGRFHISDTEAFAQRVAQLLDLAVETRPGSLHLQRR